MILATDADNFPSYEARSIDCGEAGVMGGVNRREALGVLGTLSAAASLATTSTPAEAGIFHPHSGRRGVFGKMTGAKAAVAALQAESVRGVFGIPGAQNNEFWDAMKTANLPYLLCTHELSCSVMADAAARVTGDVGVFSVIPGPGLTNAMTGLGEALLDSIPIVGLITDVDRRPGAPIGQVHSLANGEIIRSVTKGVFVVRHQAEIPTAIHEAFRLARSGEPGPVGVLLPYVFLTQSWDYEGIVPPPHPVAFDENAYRKAVGLLSDRRQRIGIYAGLGCQAATPQLTAVAELLQAPVATSVSGKGTIPDSHPLAVGWGYGPQATRTAEKQFKDVDIVLAVGVRFSEVSTAGYSIPKNHKIIHVDINQNNLGKNVPTAVCVHSDAQVFLNQLLADSAMINRPPCPPLWKRIKTDRDIDRAQYAIPQIEQCVDPMYFLNQLRCQMGPDELFFIDVTASTHWASESVEVAGPRRYFAPADNQSMGWAIPASIAGQWMSPGRRVACITGDGCFLMSAIEMSTAARAGLPVKFFVLDDGAYHYMQMLQEPVYRRTTATELANINYAAFAQAIGLPYHQISHNIEVAGGIAAALATPGPVLTRVVVSYEGREIRWLSALKANYLKHTSTDQKVRMATRVAGRSLKRHPDND